MMPDRKEREKELHVKLAHEYDEKREGTRNGRYYSKEWLRVMIRNAKIPKRAKVLDIGCGTGIFYEVLKEEGLECFYVGVDLSEDMLEVGRKRYPGIDLRVMDCEHLDFPDKQFDVVFMRSVLHHIPHPVDSIREMRRVAKRTVVVSEPLNNVLTEFPRYLSRKLTDHFDEDHTHFTKNQLRGFLRKGGIRKFDLCHFGYLAYPWGFTDIVPGAKHLPLTILKGLFKADLAIAKIPLLRHFSWHVMLVCRV